MNKRNLNQILKSNNTRFKKIEKLTSMIGIPIPSVTPSITPTISITPSITPSTTPSITPSTTPSITPSATPSITPTISITPSITPSATPSITPTISITPSITPSTTPSITPTISITPSITPSATPSITPTISITPSITPSATPSITPSATPSITPSATPSITPSATPSITPSATPSITPTISITPSITPSTTPITTFNLTSSTPSVNEGGSFTITLSTQGVFDGVTVPYTISGINANDITESLTGDFTINNNTATKTFNVVEDFTTEGTQIFTLTLNNNADSINVTINDTSISPEDQSLSVLFLGSNEPFSARSQDTEELFTNSQYTSDPTALDTKLDSDNYDVVAFNNVDWLDDGIIFPNSTTYNKLKDFVTRGGTVMHWGEHWGKDYYFNDPDGTTTGSGTVANIAYDLGGIIDTNSGWKARTDTSQGTSYPTQIALDNDVINNTSHTTTYAEYVINSRSKGMPILDAKGNTTLSIVHMWDGNITGHLNSGITGKIITFGDASGLIFTSNVNNFKNNMLYPLFDYIARTKTINWKQLGQDIDGEAANDESGSSVSMNAVGNRVAIGAIVNSDNGYASGHTRIYEYSNGTWSQLGNDIDGEAADDQSGYSVSMNDTGNRVAIGAIFNDSNGNGFNYGHTRIYEWRQYTAEDVGLYYHASRSQNDTQPLPLIITEDFTTPPQVNQYYWTQIGLDINGEAEGDRSGESVSMNAEGNRVAIGATWNATRAGHTRIYEFSNGTWTQLGSDIDGKFAQEYSGRSVSMNAAGNRVAIGATDTGYDGGHTRIYEYNGTDWVQLGLDIDGEAANDNSGWSVSMNATGNRVAIGARQNDGSDFSSGHTRIYEYINDTWIQLGQDIDGEAFGDVSGYSVSMNDAGNRVAIGAIYNDDNGTHSGHTRIYEWRQYTANDDGLYHYESRVQDNTQTNPLIITENFTTPPVVGVYYWTQIGRDIDGEAGSDNSGRSVSINAVGNRVAIGAPFNDGSGSNSGHTRIYWF